MTRIVQGSITGPDQVIQTEIEFDGTIAGVFVLTFRTLEEAQDYKNNSALKHMLPFYEEVDVSGYRVRLRRKRTS